jgi:hypothetical protein
VLSCKVNGYNIAELSSMEVGELIGVIRSIKVPTAKQIVDDLVRRLQNLIDIGLDYLTLNRETDTLSGGEAQRVKLVKHLGSSLIDVMYIFDEPSVGLHPRDVHSLNEMLQKLRDMGQHGAGGGARPGRDQGGGPHRGPRPARRHSGRRDRLPKADYAGLLEADTLTGSYHEGGDAHQGGVPQAKGQLKLGR